MFSRPPKITLQIWPNGIFLQGANMLHGQELCKEQQITPDTEKMNE